MKIFKLPDLGEGLPDAIIREWHVKEGEAVKKDQPIVAMETAKALVDVVAPFDAVIEKLFGKEVIIGELQAEPWCSNFVLSNCSLQEQEKRMNLSLFRQYIQFGRETGLKEFYLWGAEWWYWMKEKQNKPEIWNEVKKLFNL